MRMKMVTESQTLKDAAKEFLAYKKAQAVFLLFSGGCLSLQMYFSFFLADRRNSGASRNDSAGIADVVS